MVILMTILIKNMMMNKDSIERSAKFICNKVNGLYNMDDLIQENK